LDSNSASPWSIVTALPATDEQDAERRAVIDALSEAELVALYRGLVRTRRLDEALARLVRQGAITKAWPSTGEEALAVGPARALVAGPRGDVIAPVIRNSGACHEFGMPVSSVVRAYLGTADSPSGGRDGHYGDAARGVLPPISHLGDMVPVVAGVALSFKLRAERRVALAWIGDGTARAGTTHEGLNLAAVQRVPAVFIIQNNQIALGTPVARHGVAPVTGGSPFAGWPRAYGMWGAAVDGNDVLDCHAATRLAADRCRAGGGPVMLVAETFRMGGHATHDEADARRVLGAEPFAAWARRDPIALCEARLVARGVGGQVLAVAAAAAGREVEAGVAEALESRASRMPRGASGIAGVYAG
jgi:TPP-dependent pyruvate/acetoin dehydrogenase alpha subunit